MNQWEVATSWNESDLVYMAACGRMADPWK
jgi:hypothetical protein